MNWSRALVLGGGGVAGIAWETGVLCGLADHGLDVTNADLVIGTSAGATVAAQITSGATLDDLFERQLTPNHSCGELDPPVDVGTVAAMFIQALQHTTSPEQLRRAIGADALAAATVDEPARRAVIEHRLPVHTWPAGRDIRLTAVDAETGAPKVLTIADAATVTLVDAVAASCAVPGVWPPVTIAGTRYIDGGVRSSTNLDLAAHCDVIIVLSPSQDIPGVADPAVLAAKDRLIAEQRMTIVRPDADSTDAIGANPLDLSTRAPAASAGRAQGRRITAELDAFWNSEARLD